MTRRKGWPGTYGVSELHASVIIRACPDRLAGRGGWRVEVPGPTRSTVGVGLAGQGAGADGAGQPTRALA